MTRRVFSATTFALAGAIIVASFEPAAAGLFRKKEREAVIGGGGVAYMTPGEARRTKREIYQKPLILNNKVYPGMKFEPPNSAFFGGNPMIGPSSW
jgi:hypothetical protein